MGKFIQKIVYEPAPDDTGHRLEIYAAEMAYLVAGVSNAYEEIFSGLNAVIRAANEVAERNRQGEKVMSKSPETGPK